jgi:hypothetical protein
VKDQIIFDRFRWRFNHNGKFYNRSFNGSLKRIQWSAISFEE